jgi:3,4-dihydroxy 2-butanone 4-phosphate synthase/GTP cyclohydrolase II
MRSVAVPLKRLIRSEEPGSSGIPFVTISYAQSIDGSIAAFDRRRLLLSCPESTRFIHRLRASHDAILVGIRTVLADNPCLTVRAVAGRHPQPVIVDSRLRVPPDSFVMCRHPLKPWIAADATVDPRTVRALEARGATVLRVPGEDGRIDLKDLLTQLATRNIRRLMVEGGAEIITSLLSARLADRIVVTIAPLFVGGRGLVSGERAAVFQRLSLRNIHYRYLGRDIVMQGEPAWGES